MTQGWKFLLSPEMEQQRRDLTGRLKPHLGGLALADDPYLSTSDVALLLRVSPATIRRWADAGKLHAGRSLGGHRMFRLSAVRAALKEIEG